MQTPARTVPRRWHRLVVLGPLLFAGLASAEPLPVGGAFPALALTDQHGETRSVDADTKLVLFSRDMDGGKLIREALAESDEAFLAERRAVYVSDVSRMPGLVRSAIAKPRMRRRAYPVLLDEDGAPTAELPSESGKASLLFLDSLVIRRIEYAESADAVRRALSGEPRP